MVTTSVLNKTEANAGKIIYYKIYFINFKKLLILLLLTVMC